MMPIIPNIVLNEDSETVGLLIIQGKGRVIINQINPSKMNVFVFLLKINYKIYS
jgi:hypothetical protein